MCGEKIPIEGALHRRSHSIPLNELITIFKSVQTSPLHTMQPKEEMLLTLICTDLKRNSHRPPCVQVLKISHTSCYHQNDLDMNRPYGKMANFAFISVGSEY